MPAAAATCAISRIATYRRRQPERTVLYRTVRAMCALSKGAGTLRF